MNTQSSQSKYILPNVAPFKIGEVLVDPPILQAPMAGFTNFAFRQIVREYGGVGLISTEMVNARGFEWMDENTPEHPDRLWGVRDEKRPLAVQIWDNQPETMAKVGRRLVDEFQASVIDINFGCPVKKITEKAKSGSYLLGNPDRVGEIVSQVVKACAPTPVTAKIRLGYTRGQINAIDIAQAIEASGAAALTVHGRTAQDMFRGHSDWERISRIKLSLKKVPLIGNGDLDSAKKVLQAFKNYEVDGVMIARACLGRPWIFSQCYAALKGEPIPPDPSMEEQRACLLHHFGLIVNRFGENKGAQLMRRYACSYAQGRKGARLFRTHVSKINTAAEFFEVVDRYFPN